MSNVGRKMNNDHVCRKLKTTNHGSLEKNISKTDIFTVHELTTLLNPDLYADKSFYLLYLCCLSGALRSGEARGLRAKQILFDQKAILVDCSVKNDGKLSNYKKEHWKRRIVPLPENALNLLREHIAKHKLSGESFIFKGRKEPDKPVTDHYLRDNLKRIMKKAGIELNGRRFMVNSFSFSFIAFMRRELPNEMFNKTVALRIIKMTDYYCNERLNNEPPSGLAEATKQFAWEHEKGGNVS